MAESTALDVAPIHTKETQSKMQMQAQLPVVDSKKYSTNPASVIMQTQQQPDAYTSSAPNAASDEQQNQMMEEAARVQLLPTLAAQLEYYFSPANLARDTYLKTIMDLNSGYVPTTVLATFANVNRIARQSSLAFGSAPPQQDQLASLLPSAAALSSLLEVVSLDANGHVVVRNHDDAAAVSSSVVETLLAAVDLHKNHTSSKEDAEEEGSQESTAPSTAPSEEDNKAAAAASPVYVMAIGPKKYVNQETNYRIPSSPPRVDQSTTTILLRDVPESVKREEIVEVLTFEGFPKIIDVQAEVGNCWYVSFTATSNQEMITALLELRTKRLGGEPIKARLKTKTERSYSSSPNNNNTNNNTAANAQMLATDATSATFPPSLAAMAGGGPPRSTTAKVYAGDRAIMAGKRKDLGNRNKTNGSNQDYANGAPNKTGAMSGSRRKDSGGSLQQQQNQPPPPRGNMTGGDGKSTGKGRLADKIRQTAVPAPPLGDSHFPALGEKKTVEVAVTTTAVVTGAKDVTTLEENTGVVAEDSLSASQMEVTQEKKDEAVKKPVVAGYAAALLKAAPPSVPSTIPAPQTTTASKAQNATSSSVSQSPKRGGSNHGKKGQQTKAHQKGNNDGRGSKAGVSRKGHSNGKAGDKQPNHNVDVADMKVVDPTPIAPVAPTWGGGKTFADILKKAEDASNMS